MRSLPILAALVLLAAAGAPHAQELARRPAPMPMMIRDGIAGGLVGSAVAGGLVAYNLGVQGHGGYDWGRALAWGAGIGVGAGLVLGMFDLASSRRAAVPRGPVRDGLSRSLDARARDQSHSHLFPVLTRIFF